LTPVKTANEVLEIAKQERVRFLRLQFTDILGQAPGLQKTPRIPQRGRAATKGKPKTAIEHVGTALQSRPARAIPRLKIRTGLQTRPHMFYHLSETASRQIHARIKAC
jgi:glutamine synthetase